MTGTEQAELLFLLMHSKEREDLKSKVFKCFFFCCCCFSMSGTIRKLNDVLLNHAVLRRVIRVKETVVVYRYVNKKIYGLYLYYLYSVSCLNFKQHI